MATSGKTAGTIDPVSRAVVVGLITAMMALILAGCGITGSSQRFQEGQPPKWFRERHETVLRDFYGYQIRTRQRREKILVAKVLRTDRWWEGERRRFVARERMIGRDQEIERNFFLMQIRQEKARNRGDMADLEVRRAFFAAQFRAEQELKRRERQDAAARELILRGESVRRQTQVHQLSQSRLAAQRLANRPLAPVRGVPSNLQRRRQPGGFGPAAQPGGLGATGAGGPGGGGFMGGATVPPAGGGVTGAPGVGAGLAGGGAAPQ